MNLAIWLSGYLGGFMNLAIWLSGYLDN